MSELRLNTAESARLRITEEQQKSIQKLYKNASKEIAKQAKKAPRVPSDSLKKMYLNNLRKQVDKQVESIGRELKEMVEGNMRAASDAVVAANQEFLREIGMPIEGSFSHVSDSVVRSIVTGQLYEGNWSLSHSIWSGTKKTQQDIRSIIAQGVAQNKSSYDIAKDLEKYVDPAAQKEWDWSKVYPGTAKKVDYNAQRLARTMVSHAYQQSFVRTTKKNPFVTEYQWLSSGGERMCELCEERDGQMYPKDDLPLDHPNGMCTFKAVIPDDMTAIADRLADWAEGKPDPELDIWERDLYGIPEPVQRSSVVNGVDLSDTWVRRPDQFKFEIDDVLNAQGFDGMPKVVSPTEFDAYVKNSKFIAQRTYSAQSKAILDEYRNQLYRGKWYVDCSTGGANYGQGMYCVADYTGTLTEKIKSDMDHYQYIGQKRFDGPIKTMANMLGMTVDEYVEKHGIGVSSYVETFTLDPSAKMIGSRDIQTLRWDTMDKVKSYYSKHAMESIEATLSSGSFSDFEKDYVRDRLMETDIGTDRHTKVVDWWKSLPKEEKKREHDKLYSLISDYKEESKRAVETVETMDDGVIAALNGYDAIDVSGSHENGSYAVILNRTKCIFRDGG